MEAKKQVGIFKNLAMIACISYLAVHYALNQVYLSLVIGIAAMVLTVLAVIAFRQARKEARQKKEVKVKPNFRKRNY